MTWEEVIAWGIILGLFIAVTWLMVAAGRWLWARWVRPPRVRWQERPAAPSPQSVNGPPAPERTAGQPQAPSPAPANVELGPPRHVEVDMQALFGGTRVRRGALLTIPAPQDPLWAEKGWRREGNTYHGQFRANGRSWRGMIQEPYPGGYRAHIWDPPLGALDGHPHRPCFMNPTSEGRYDVHFRSAPTSLDHAITNIEQILREVTSARR